MSSNISQDKIKLNVARIKKFGNNFEINIDPEAAIKYKRGEISDLNEVLLADNIFSDAKKGEIASDNDLQQAFKTTNTSEIAKIILSEGEVQATAEHRAQEREQKRKKLINLINTMAIDPNTNLPIPATRIENALEEGKIHLDDNKTVEEQFDDIISKLRPILPIKIEQKQLTLEFPAQFSGKAQGPVRKYQIIKEDWTSQGNWKVQIELPAGLMQEFIDQMNSLTSGQVVVEINSG